MCTERRRRSTMSAGARSATASATCRRSSGNTPRSQRLCGRDVARAHRKAARDCLVPDWPRYYGTELAQYDRFIFYGLRMVSSLIYTAYYSPTKRLADRYTEATGERLDNDGLQWLRRESHNLALAIIDNFMPHGHRTPVSRRRPSRQCSCSVNAPRKTPKSRFAATPHRREASRSGRTKARP